MAENEKDWKYRVKYERSAGVGKTDGFTAEAQGDELEATSEMALSLYNAAINDVQARFPVLKDTSK